jgi:hypothetical protein
LADGLIVEVCDVANVFDDLAIDFKDAAQCILD